MSPTIVSVGGHGTIRTLLREVSRRESHLDLRFACRDGRIWAHKLMIGAQSRFLRRIMLENSGEEDLTIVLPNVRIHDMKVVLKFLYTGRLYLTQEDIPVVQELLERVLKVDARIVMPQTGSTSRDDQASGRKDEPGSGSSSTPGGASDQTREQGEHQGRPTPGQPESETPEGEPTPGSSKAGGCEESVMMAYPAPLSPPDSNRASPIPPPLQSHDEPLNEWDKPKQILCDVSNQEEGQRTSPSLDKPRKKLPWARKTTSRQPRSSPKPDQHWMKSAKRLKIEELTSELNIGDLKGGSPIALSDPQPGPSTSSFGPEQIVESTKFSPPAANPPPEILLDGVPVNPTLLDLAPNLLPYLPPPIPMAPEPDMEIYRGEWVPRSKLNRIRGHRKAVKGIRRYNYKPFVTISGQSKASTAEAATSDVVGEFPCPYSDVCDAVFERQRSLDSHISRNHRTNHKASCPECGKGLSTATAIKKHLLSHRPEADWPYFCPLCHKKFQAKGDLPKHFLTLKHRDHVPPVGSREWVELINQGVCLPGITDQRSLIRHSQAFLSAEDLAGGLEIVNERDDEFVE